MNHWAIMLGELPALGQRTIARVQRISLPRGCSASERLLRLRRALCRAATVRSVYALLEDDTRAALRELAAERGGMALATAEQRFGPLRSWKQLAADPVPRNPIEALVVRGWLLPRPASPRHPAHLIVPPELRRTLPALLALEPYAPANALPLPAAHCPPAVRAAQVLLLACAAAPLPVRLNGALTVAALRRLAAPGQVPDAALLRFLLPLLTAAGLVRAHGGMLRLAGAAQRFLGLSVPEQREQLLHAWQASAEADHWLVPLLPNPHGIDWPVLRRKLLGWAEHLPQAGWYAADGLYEQLAAAHGPLADAHTHSYRVVRRVPWQPRRAATVWRAALDGPLRWLGVVEHCALDGVALVGRATGMAAVPPWSLAADNHVIVPHGSVERGLLELALWLQPETASEHCDTFRLVRPVGETEPAQDAAMRQVLEQHANGENALEILGRPAPVRLGQYTLLLADTPADLQAALTHRSVRRYVGERLAPGLALVTNHQRLARALARVRQVVQETPAHVPPPAEPAPAMPEQRLCTLLRAALKRQRLVSITYQSGAHGPWTQRIVRPLELHQRSDYRNSP